MNQNSRSYRRTGHLRSNGSNANQSASRDEDDLFVFGYHCSIFRDDQKAEHVDFGRHLMPLTYDPSTTIDRYDCRLLLNNVPEISTSPMSLSLEEQEMEYLCDEERYKDLREIESASTSAGATIPYDYGAATVNQDNVTVNKDENSTSGSDDDDLFAPSPLLKVPADMITPSSFVQNTVIEKTAIFVAQKGPQMEIIVNAKQKSNKRFRFLDFDNPLHKYYKHVLKMVREKRYTPVFDNLPPKKEKKKIVDLVKHENPSDGSDDEGGDYMHPSFFSTNKTTSTSTEPPKPEIILPTIDYKIGQEKDVYSALYNRLSAFIPKKEEKESMPIEILEHTSSGAPPVPPPPDVQPVVDRLALYVARNGPEFENMVRSGGDERFKFVNVGHPYYPYYQSRLQYYQYEIYMAYVGQTFMAALNETTATNSSPQNPIPTYTVVTANAASSNSPSTTIAEIIDDSSVVTEMKPFHKPIGTSISFTFNKPKDKQSQENDQTESSNEMATDDLLLEKLNQDAPDDKADELLKEERRRKARLFLNMLKKNKTTANGGSTANSPKETNQEKVETDANAAHIPSKAKKRRFDVMYKV